MGPNKLSIILRHLDERTKNVTKHHLENLFKVPVHEVSSIPFANTLIKSYELAARLDSDWILMVDADIIPLDSIVKFVNTITDSDRYAGCTPLVLDKLWQYPRSAGIHLYSASIINQILSKLINSKTKKDVKKSTRPETYCKQMVCDQKNKWGLYGEVVGLHDFEQSYQDIYRTTSYFANKWSEPIATKIPMWIEKSETDPDFQFALLGFANGLGQIISNLDNNKLKKLPNNFNSLLTRDPKGVFSDTDRKNLIYEIEKSDLAHFLKKKLIKTSEEDIFFPNILHRILNLFKRYPFHNAFKLLLAKLGRKLEKNIFKIH